MTDEQQPIPSQPPPGYPVQPAYQQPPGYVTGATATGYSVTPPEVPGITGFVIGAVLAVIAVVGIVVAVLGFVMLFTSAGDLQRFVAPGSVTVKVTSPNERVDIFSEAIDGRPPAVSVTGLRVTAPDGSEVALNAPRTSLTYDMGSHRGRRVAAFTASTSGTYTVRDDTPPLSNGSVTMRTAFAVGNLNFGAGFARAFAGIAVAVLFGIGAVALFVITGIRRSSARSKRRALGLPT